MPAHTWLVSWNRIGKRKSSDLLWSMMERERFSHSVYTRTLLDRNSKQMLTVSLWVNPWVVSVRPKMKKKRKKKKIRIIKFHSNISFLFFSFLWFLLYFSFRADGRTGGMCYAGGNFVPQESSSTQLTLARGDKWTGHPLLCSSCRVLFSERESRAAADPAKHFYIVFLFSLFSSFAGRRVFFLLIPPVVDGKEMQNKKKMHKYTNRLLVIRSSSRRLLLLLGRSASFFPQCPSILCESWMPSFHPSTFSLSLYSS